MTKRRHRTRKYSLHGVDRYHRSIISSDEDWYPSLFESYVFPSTTTEYAKGIIDVTGSKRAIDNPLLIDEHAVTNARESFTLSCKVRAWSGSRDVYFDILESASGYSPPAGGAISETAFYGSHLEHPPLEETKGEYVTKMAARLNPSRPAVDLGVNVAEMVGAPIKLFSLFRSTLRNGGKRSQFGLANLPTKWSDPGTAYLRLQYGLMPIIRDMRKLLELTNEIDKKIEKVRRLKEHGFLRASSKKFPEVHTSTIRIPFHDGVGGLWEIRSTRVVTRWCTLYYTADTDSLPTTDADTRNMANKVLYGASLDGVTLWNAMPWSWFIDWFSNFGDYIESQRNTIGAKLTKSLVMETTEYETVVSNIVAPSLASKLEYQIPFLSGFRELEGAGYEVLSGSLIYRCADRINRSVSKTREEVQPSATTDLALSNLLSSGFRSSIVAALAFKSIAGRR